MSTTPPTPDLRSYNRKLLDQIRALLSGKALDDVAMYKIGTRELTHIPLPELLQWEATVEARVRNERRRAQGLPRRGSFVMFGAAERRGPRFATFRLLLGRLLIAVLSDPSNRVPEIKSQHPQATLTRDLCQCRGCKRWGPVLDEFTSPYTGLCRDCSVPGARRYEERR